MSDDIQRKPPLTPVIADARESEAPESFTDAIRPLVPVITTYLDHQARVSEQQTQIQKQQLDLSKLQTEGNLAFAKDRLRFEQTKQAHSFYLTIMLVGPIVIVALGSAAGLIFVKDNVQAGVFLLTHLVAAALGILGGVGWQKSKQESQRKS